ncbi:MAG: branched-chain amino acid transporter [Chlamydiae bacterium]|nr:branched-chain amino acid transporter [Chlamydiota bacterium]
MKTLLKSRSLSSGFALFSMFFGAGNLIFPLAIGQFAGEHNLYAMIGLIITAVIVPFLGVIAILLFDGSYQNFFARLGKWPGFLLALSIITLIGPLGCTPRCIALAFSTVKTFFPGASSILFSAGACLIILAFTLRQNKTIEMLGRVLTPVLLLGLGFIIYKGFTAEGSAMLPDSDRISLFFHGLKEGYNTMDLLAAFFFSSTVIAMLKTGNDEIKGATSHFKRTLKATAIGAGLLSLVYFGFSYIASMHASSLNLIAKEQILTSLAIKVAGPLAGIVLCVTVAATCLTTAIALVTVFTDFVQKGVLKEKVRYETILIVSLLITFFMANFEFSGISAFLGPILEVCYPGLIVLTIANIAFRLVDFKPIKFLVFLAFICSATMYFLR